MLADQIATRIEDIHSDRIGISGVAVQARTAEGKSRGLRLIVEGNHGTDARDVSPELEDSIVQCASTVAD